METWKEHALKTKDKMHHYEAREGLYWMKSKTLSVPPCIIYQKPGSFQCSRCKRAFYCLSGYQTKDWKQHYKDAPVMVIYQFTKASREEISEVTFSSLFTQYYGVSVVAVKRSRARE
jgi:hypothetical protein